jgi:DNA-binding response OmpR family regulator
MLSGLLSDSPVAHAPVRAHAQPCAWPTLLVVDSDVEMTRTLVCFFEKRRFHVAAGNSLADAKAFFHRCKSWTLIISDYHLADGTGGELCDWLRDQGCDAPMLLMSSSPHCGAFAGDVDFLPKPFTLEKLEAFVRSAQRQR